MILDGVGFHFQPFSRKQQQVMNWWRAGSPFADYDMVIADGAIRSGKTIAMICGFLIWAQTVHRGQHFIVAGRSIGSLKRNVIAPLLKIIRTWGWEYHYNRSELYIEIGSNTYHLFGANTEASQDTLQGMTAAGAFADEGALFPQSFFDQMVGRCSVPGSRVWVNCNPRHPLHWFKTEWIDKADEKHAVHLHFTMDDNRSLGEEVKARFRRMFSGVFFQRYILGLWVQAEGVIYDMFSEERHVFAPGDAESSTAVNGREHSEWYASCDYGTQNATVFGLWGKVSAGPLKGKWIREREYYYSGRDEQAQKTDAEYYTDLLEFVGDIPARVIVIDPSAASFITAVKQGGRFTVRKAKNDVLTGIRETSTALCNDEIGFADCGVHWLKEVHGYSWDKKAVERGEDKPLKVGDHTCLVASTKVLTSDGEKRIADIKAGEYVWTRDGWRAVTASGMTRASARVFTVRMSNGRTITGTADHPVYVCGSGWKRIDELRYGDVLDSWETQGAAPHRARVNARVLSVRPSGLADTYNLTVDGSPEFVASGVVVHNCDEVRYFVMTILRGTGRVEVFR